MSVQHITYLKNGGYLRVEELTREEHFGRVEEGIFGVSDRQALYTPPEEQETSIRYYAPSRSLKARLRVIWWNLKEKYD